jgi:sulfoacetaldehyde dehydrogenase
VRSKTFDNATSCSSENSLVVVEDVRAEIVARLEAGGAVLLNAAQKAVLRALMWPQGKLSPAVIGQSARVIAQRAAALDGTGAAGWALIAERNPTMLLVDEDGVGPDHPFSGEKLSPVLTLFTVRDFAEAAAMVARIYAFEGAGHSVGLHSARPERALELGLTLPVSRVIVNQAHCIATGGSFDNGLPFSLSMGCGTWGKNNFSDNMNYRHYLNITRISRGIREQVPTEQEIFGGFFQRYGRA